MSTDTLNAGLVPFPSRTIERLEDKRASYAQRNEARVFALRIVRDPIYQENLLTRARTGTLAPGVETLLMHYAWGRPADRIELGPPGSFSELSELSTEELAERAKAVSIAARTLLASSEELESETDSALSAAQNKGEARLSAAEQREAKERETVTDGK